MPYTVPFSPKDRYVNQRASTISDLILRSADNRANAVQRGGEITGQMFSNLGAQTQGTIASLLKERQEAPIRAQEAQMRTLDIQAKKDAATDRTRTLDAQKVVDALPFFASGQGRDAMLSALDGPARELAMEHYQKADEAKARLDQLTAATQAANANTAESQQKIQAGQLDVFGALAAGVKAHNYEPGAFFGAVADAVHKGLLPLEQAGPMVAHGLQNPAWIKQTTDELIARSPEQQQLEEKRLAEQRMAEQARVSAANLTADNERQAQALTLQQQQAAEAARHNRATEGQAAATLAANNRAPDVNADIRTTGSGRKYIDLSLYQGKARDAARDAGTKAGAVPVSKENADALREIDNARLNQQSILDQVLPLLPTDPTGRIVGAGERSLSKVLQTNEQRAAFNSWRTAAIQTLRATAGSKGLRINQAEIAQAIANDIPTLNDTVAVAQQKVKNINIMLDNAETATLGPVAGGPRPAPSTLPAVGSTFQGGKVLKVEKVQ